MKKEIYICDFCKKEFVDDKKLKNFYYDLTHVELCEECYEIAINKKDIFEKKYKKLYEDFKNEIIKLKKGVKNNEATNNK